MRSLGIGFVLAGLILASASDADAQRAFSSRELNERINALRSRLQNYHLERVCAEPENPVLVNENETVEIKFEKLVEEFEARDDVAVTVLFHDPDFAGNTAKSNPPAVAKPKKQPVVTAQAPTNPDAAQQLELERSQRQEKYNELRRRVQMATRRTREGAQQINSMVAQIP